MGLDIHAYKNLKEIESVYDFEDGCHEPKDKSIYDYIFMSPNEHFLTQNMDFKLNMMYSYDKDYLSFRVGSYSSYVSWREKLAKFVGYKPVDSTYHNKLSHQEGAFEYETGDFLELICFSDCDGFIGTSCSKKLFNDFVRNRDKILEIFKDDECFIRT